MKPEFLRENVHQIGNLLVGTPTGQQTLPGAELFSQHSRTRSFV